MEEIPIIAQKITKQLTVRRPNYKPRSLRGGSIKNDKQRLPDPPAAGQVVFRMLCRVNTAGGVIGNSGSIIKYLETLTGSKLRFEEGQPNCIERVVNIVGDAAVEKKMSVGDSGEEDLIEVSKAQEGLIRVFERLLEVEGSGENNEESSNEQCRNGFIGCRLLMPVGQVGAVMGKGGKIVDSIRKSSGAKIRVLKKDQIPACAGSDEELIQITGGAMAVKKALLAVSNCLQDRALEEGTPGHMSSHGSSQNLNADLNTNNRLNLPSFSGRAVKHPSVGQSLSEDFERTLTVDDEISLRKVVFKYLCSNGVAGGVIGKGANIVKSLEKETGASIKFTSPVSGSKERLVIISSLESPNPLYSPAQIAIIRVFARCVEVGLDQGEISSIGDGDRVTASIMVTSTQIGCLLNEDGSITADISMAASVEIKYKGADFQNYAGENDRVVQITGEYDNVKSALVQVTGRLRENVFSEKGHQGANLRHCTYLSTLSSRPYGKEEASCARLSPSSRSYANQFDSLGLVGKSTSTHSTDLLQEQTQKNNRGSIPRSADNAGHSPTHPSHPEHESIIATKIPKTVVEVVIPVKEFRLVYGENCSNLTRLKEISGAAVVVQDPSPGDSFGKVIISGMPEQIQIAQSLLQAFISI